MSGNVVIERLLFQLLSPQWVEDFIIADNQVWLPWLQRQKGFLRKTHSVHPGGLVETLLYWKDRESLEKASNSPDLANVEAMFRSKMGMIYRLVRSS